MANQELLNQLYQALAQSPSFQLLPPEKQSELKQGFANATDDQIQQALQEVQQTNLEASQNEQKRQEHAKTQAQSAQALKQEMAQEQKVELKENEEKDAAESEEEAEKILASIGQKDQPKRKKIFGIF
jgi:hypothetical protein